MKDTYYRMQRKKINKRNSHMIILAGIAAIVSLSVIVAAAVMNQAEQHNKLYASASSHTSSSSASSDLLSSQEEMFRYLLSLHLLLRLPVRLRFHHKPRQAVRMPYQQAPTLSRSALIFQSRSISRNRWTILISAMLLLLEILVQLV